VSAAVVGNAKLSSFDVIVVGSGAGGSAAASVLCANGLKVLVLEGGPNRFTGLDDPSPGMPTSTFANDDLKLGARGFVHQHPTVDARTFRSDESTVRAVVGHVNGLPKTVGGGTVHADMKTPRFAPTDFQLGTLLGDAREVSGVSFADWPVGYDALEPFYTHAEGVMGVQGLAGSSPFDPPRSAPYPMKPGVPMYLARRLSAGAAALGYHPQPQPSAITSRPYQGRPACVDCGFCGDFGCPTNAKGSAAVTTLRRALLTGNCQLRPETRVVRLVLSSTGTSVAGVEALGPSGERRTFTADRYVLAAGPIEDARLLLLSDPGGAGVGNSSGLVGRNLMFHLQTVAIGIFAERLHGHRGRTVTHGMTDFRGVPGDPSRPLGGVVEFGPSRFPIEEAQAYGAMGARLKALIRQSPLRDHLCALVLHGEDAPQARNRVDLDPAVVDLDRLPVPRITYQNHAFELSARAFYGPKMIAILGAAGALYGFIAPLDVPPRTRHVMGTLRFGASPATSVCAPSGRFHDVGNLYAADGSLFPTSSGFPPTLTITALSTYVAGEMVSPGSPAKALRAAAAETVRDLPRGGVAAGPAPRHPK
jgi:choline dehydrogenase-like flavoprotein